VQADWARLDGTALLDLALQLQGARPGTDHGEPDSPVEGRFRGRASGALAVILYPRLQVAREVLDLPTVRSVCQRRWSCLVAGQVAGNA
jgi:hypothetical protein